MTPKMSNHGPIIVVEDDIDDQYLIKKICDEIGVTGEVIFFEDGQIALEYLSDTTRETFLILCDINMPRMNGLELRRRINENDSLRRKSIPFVFLSTAARPSDVADAYDMTVQGFFLKESNYLDMKHTLNLIMMYWNKCKHPNTAH